ncbi:TetR/AcrR family transcriptional regulator [Vogesella sp. LIG4]|uniref:TetR/AcrR family transcriptional regulator n=1 Tax=Vogesella sp. LIG4 TaxID=1192162 RepID=UPI0008201760|nr:TetR/AcrR family transcriptional regulator [Vogesella sp. LIG4]SCK23569.1 transcriptional regulator, TetR family [Vogesella sp. LIG4]
MTADLDARHDTRKKILDLAETLLLTRGFNAFSYQHISAELGMRNAAIHYHFARKTDLGVALIERYRRRFARFIAAQAGLAPAEQLTRYYALSDSYHQRQQICPSGILSAELHTLPAEMQQAAGAFVAEMRAWAVDIVARGRADGSMHYAGSAEGMGALVFAAMQGALQLARFDAAAIGGVTQQLAALLGLATVGNNKE